MDLGIKNNIEPVTVKPRNIHHHFSRIAKSYRNLRTTDLEPVALIARTLGGMPRIEAADIGCGGGRYDLLLYQHLGDKLHLSCVDTNNYMLNTLDDYLKRHGISNFKTINAEAEKLPFPGNTFDCIFTFNAVHHFNLSNFLRESARVLRSGGYIFIYTRLREQNKRNIWGRYFPQFFQKETRLHKLDSLLQTVQARPSLQIQSIDYLKYARISTLERLVERARAHHYSTFYLYLPEELEEAIAGFRQNIERHFEDTTRVEWNDENILLTLKNTA